MPHSKHGIKETAPKVSKGRRLASGESAGGGSRKQSDNDRKAPLVAPTGSKSLPLAKQSFYTMLNLNDYKDAERRIAKGDASPVASPPKAEVVSGATMIAKPFARLRRGEILLLHR